MNAGEVRVQVSADTSEFKRKMDGVNRELSGLNKHTKGITGAMDGLVGALGGVASGLAVAAAGLATLGAVRGLQINAEVENASIALTTLTGSAEKAKKMIGELRKIGAESPFNFDSLQQSAKLLLAMGIKAKNVVPYIRNIGDAVAAVGGGSDEIERVSLAIAQMSAKGKISAEEMNQLAENGIPAWQILSKKMGKSTQELMKMGEQGKLFSKDVIPLLMEGLNDKFGGAMKNASKSFSGMLEQMKEQADMVLGGIFEPLFEGLKKVMPKINDFLSNFNEQIKKEGFGNALLDLFTPDFLKSKIDLLKNSIKLMGDAIKNGDWEWLGRLLVEHVKEAFDIKGDITDAILKWFDKIDWDKITSEFITGLNDFTVGIVKQLDEKTGKALENGDTIMASYGLGVWFGKAVQSVITDLGNISDTFANAAAEALRGAFVTVDWEKAGKSAGLSVGANGGFILGFFQGMLEGVNFDGILNTIANSLPVGQVMDIIFRAFEVDPKQTPKAFENLKIITAQTFDSIKQSIYQKMYDAYTNVSKTVGDIRNSVSTAGTNLVNDVRTRWDNIKTTVSQKINDARNNVVTTVNDLRAKVSAKWEDIKNSARTKFDQVKDAILNPIKNAKKTIEGIINDIKNAFKSIKISIPKPRIPIPEFHFSKGNLLKGVLPSFSVTWHAKGGIATGASIVGVGEKGDEAIVPLSQKHRMRPFAQAVAGMIKEDGKQGEFIINNYFNINATIREEADIQKLSERLNKLQERTQRAGGVRTIGN